MDLARLCQWEHGGIDGSRTAEKAALRAALQALLKAAPTHYTDVSQVGRLPQAPSCSLY